MAQGKNESANTAPSGNVKTAAEIQEWYEKNKTHMEKFDAAMNAVINLRDITKSQTRTITAFNKDEVVNYLKNIGANEVRLRELAWY